MQCKDDHVCIPFTLLAHWPVHGVCWEGPNSHSGRYPSCISLHGSPFWSTAKSYCAVNYLYFTSPRHIRVTKTVLISITLCGLLYFGRTVGSDLEYPKRPSIDIQFWQYYIFSMEFLPWFSIIFPGRPWSDKEFEDRSWGAKKKKNH